MKFLLILFAVGVGLTSSAQKEVKLEEVKNFIGDSVKVQGIISSVRFLETARNTPTFINVGGAYPNQLLTVVIWGAMKKAIALPPTSRDAGNTIIVSGKVELYENKPQIVIKDPKQFQIVQDAQKERDLP